MTDKELLDWLEKDGQGYGLISDDDKHWACLCDGVQNVPMSTPGDISTSFWIEKRHWKPTIREAIEDAIKNSYE